MIKNNTVWLLLIFLLIFVLRLPWSTAVVIDWDESAYFTVAQDVANGGVPYKTSWVHRGPIQFFLLVPIIKLFGNDIFALRIFTTMYLLVSMFFIYLIARRLFQEVISLVGPLIYGLFFTTSKFGGLASNSELFMMLPAIIAIFCFIISMQNKKYSYLTLFLSGLFSATAFFIKASAFFTVVTLMGTVLLRGTVFVRKFTDENRPHELAWYLLGGGTMCLIILCYFAFHDALFDFYYGAYLFNYHYVNTLSIQAGLKRLLSFLYRTLTRGFDFITFLALVSALFIFLKREIPKDKRKTAYFIIGLTFFSMIGVYLGRNIHPHYFLQMALPFSLLICFAISIIEINTRALNKIIYAGIMITLLGGAIHGARHMGRFFTNYNNRKDDVHYKIAGYIEANTKEDDTIFVLGGQPIIYFLSKRSSPTKYFCWLYHVDRREKILQIKDSTLTLFSENKPKYFVYSEFQGNGYLKKFMMDNYRVETTFDNYVLYRVNKEGGVN